MSTGATIQKGAELTTPCVDLAVGNFIKNIATSTRYLYRFSNRLSNYAPDAGIYSNMSGAVNFTGDPITFPGQLRINDKLHGGNTTAPASGTWVKGDIVYNTDPSAGGTIGWVCTVAGTPGTWKTFGEIEA